MFLLFLQERQEMLLSHTQQKKTKQTKTLTDQKKRGEVGGIKYICSLKAVILNVIGMRYLIPDQESQLSCI